MKKRSTYFLFFIVIVAMTLAALELVLRTTHLFNARTAFTDPDDLIGWHFTPHAAYWYNSENDHPITGRFNSYGWRDRDWARAKAPETLRVAMLGDSFVESFQVEEGRTFYRLAEQELTRRLGRPVECMNFGRNGFTQSEELLVLRRDVLPFQPDLVVLFFLPENDIEDASPLTARDTMRPFFFRLPDGTLRLDTSFNKTREFRVKRLINGLKHHSALVSLVCERYNMFYYLLHFGRGRSVAGPEPQPAALSPYLTLATAAPDAIYTSTYTVNKTLIAEIAAACRKAGATCLVVTINTQAYIPSVDAQWRGLAPSFRWDFFDEDLRGAARAAGAEYLGLSAAMRAAYEARGVPLHWQVGAGHGHWNYAGHTVVAGALTEKIIRVLTPEPEPAP